MSITTAYQEAIQMASWYAEAASLAYNYAKYEAMLGHARESRRMVQEAHTAERERDGWLERAESLARLN